MQIIHERLVGNPASIRGPISRHQRRWPVLAAARASSDAASGAASEHGIQYLREDGIESIALHGKGGRGGDAEVVGSSRPHGEESVFDNNEDDVGVSGCDLAEDDGEEAFPVMQLNLPTPTHTKVKKAAYLKSCVKHEDCPPPKYPEFAVIGR